MLRLPLVAIKGLLVGASIAAYLVQCLAITAVVREPLRRRRLQIWTIAFYCRLILVWMRVRVTVRGREHIDRSRPTYLICNHVSYLDVLALSSTWPAAFVTSVEVQMSGFLGAITKSGGCLFVERRNRSRLEEEKREIATVLQQGDSVFVFPEATSSNADSVLPFKAALFDCAIMAQASVQPIVLHYARINGRKPDRKLLDHALYYGDMEFLPQLLKLLSLRSLEIELHFLPRVETRGLLTDGTGRKELASTTHSLIAGTYGKLVSAGEIVS